jgi:hypothetical protein
MHPIIHGELARARIADLHRQAERDRMARAAGFARKTHDRHVTPGHLTTVLARCTTVVARRVLAVLASHSPRAASSHDRRTAPIEGGTP